MKSQGATGKIRSIIEPLEKLKRALDASGESLIVLEGSRAIYLNPLATKLLSLHEVPVEECPIEEWGLEGSVFATFQRAIDVCSCPGKRYCELFTLAETMYELNACGAPDDLMTIQLRRIEKPTPLDWDKGSVELQDTAHQHSNLLTAVMGLTELLSTEEPRDGRAGELLNEILKTASRRPSVDGSQEAAEQRIDPAKVLSELAALLRFSLPSSIQLQVDAPESQCQITICAPTLRKLFLLVATEAAREVRGAGILSLVMRSNDDSVAFEVECRCRETELYPVDDFRLRETRELCERVGGHLVIWSEGKRRVRILNLLLQAAKPDKEPQIPSNSLNERFGLGKTILLVDDDDAIRAVGSAALSRLGFSVQVAKDGIEAVELFEKCSPDIDLVLLDLVMPRLGGAGCFERLKSLDPGVKVVLMSGFTPNNRVNDLLARGCLYFLRKPFELTELVSAVKEAADRA